MTLQALYGTIPQIFGKGECARVRQMLLLGNPILFCGTAPGVSESSQGPLLPYRNFRILASGLCHLWTKE